tara:strand:- start:411 stop:1283 length:873 start_codon:yes stop_codon:yes gene_type:complete
MSIEILINTLTDLISENEKEKSSHWQKILNKKQSFLNIKGNYGYGQYKEYNLLYEAYHHIMQTIIFGRRLKEFHEYKLIKENYKKFNRQVECDVVRHIFTFNLLNKFKLLKDNVAVIGDGKANFILGSKIINPSIKLFSINLPELLINDLLIINQSNIFSHEEICVVKEEADLEKEHIKLFLIPANKNNLLESKNIDLFVNIVSFQEMNYEQINNYFSIVKSNNSYLYNCNREEKILPDGIKIEYEKYPFNNAEILFKEECIWHKSIYLSKYPYIKKYDGSHIHSLCKFN